MNAVHSLLGQAIEWTVEQAKVYDPETRRMVEPPPDGRSGVVWSAGPVTGTAWVIPDQPREDEGHAVCVLISAKGAHRQRVLDQCRSTAERHRFGLACLQNRLFVPADLGGAIGYELPRDQDSSDPRGSVFYGDVTPQAAGTCPKCARPRVQVRAMAVIGHIPGTRAQPELGIELHLTAHKIPGRGGTPCDGAGHPPAETRFTPSRLIAQWADEHGADSISRTRHSPY